MSKEYFWGDALSSTKKEIVWNPSLDDEEDFDNLDLDGIQHFLFLKQAVLGPKAKEGDRNVVEIKTQNFDGDDVQQPLFSLKLGLNESSSLDIGVQPPVTFTLTEGAGPVYISGQHMIEISADDDDDELNDEEEEEEDEEEDVDVNASPELPKSKKRPLSTSSGSAVKKTKMAKLDKDSDEDEDDDDDAEMAEMDDEDEENEDLEEEDDDAGDSEEEEEEDEEENEEEEEESPEKPVKKSKGSKGQLNGTATAKGDNKAKTQATATKLVKAKGKKKILEIDDIKEKIKESSNVPKKEEKFKNYLRSSFHISELKKLQDLWSWYRASLQK